MGVCPFSLLPLLLPPVLNPPPGLEGELAAYGAGLVFDAGALGTLANGAKCKVITGSWRSSSKFSPSGKLPLSLGLMVDIEVASLVKAALSHNKS